MGRSSQGGRGIEMPSKYEKLSKEYRSKLQEVEDNASLSRAEKFVQQAKIRLAYEVPIAKAFIEEVKGSN